MSLIPWRKKSPLNLFQRDMNRLFEDFFGSEEAGTTGALSTVWPSLNVKEDDKTVTVEAELPGIKKEDIKANVSRDLLTLSGEKKEEKKEERANYRRVERSYGAFHRQVRLPAVVDGTRAEAQMSDGVLKIKMPKSEPTDQKAIPIK